MKNRKLYMQSIRALPKKWVDEETRMTLFAEALSPFVLVYNPKFAPMEYTKGRWGKIKLT